MKKNDLSCALEAIALFCIMYVLVWGLAWLFMEAIKWVR